MIIINIFLYFLGFIFFVIGINYIFCPVYKFPKPEPFSGDIWFNPYQKLKNNNKKWYKANFHAHSSLWLGLTYGKDNPEDIFKKYSEMGYDLISISNYQLLKQYSDTDKNQIPVYEHGINFPKAHQIVFGAKSVLWKDYLIFQNNHHKQHIINKLQKKSGFVLIAHPRFNKSYSIKNMKKLTGYDAIEVLNHYGVSDKFWDTALSSGRISWVMGGDDTHDVEKSGQTGVCWTFINSRSKKEKDIIESLKKGYMIGVTGNQGKMHNKLKRAEIKNDSFIVECEKEFDELRFIGQNGKLVSEEKNKKSASLKLKNDFKYIRTEIKTKDNVFYLNPIFRTKKNNPQKQLSKINKTNTWLQRVFFVLFLSGIIYSLFF